MDPDTYYYVWYSVCIYKRLIHLHSQVCFTLLCLYPLKCTWHNVPVVAKGYATHITH